MAKLTNLASSLPKLASAFGSATREEAERTRLAFRDRTVEWRSWYHTKRWHDLRRRVFKRDNYTCRQTGELLYGRYPAPNSPVADHIKPHRGDPVLFWYEDNVQTVSKAYHDSVKQAAERAAGEGG